MSDVSGRPVSVLVIEDDPGDFGLIRAHMRSAGLSRRGGDESTGWAKTLAEGVLMAGGNKPDVVLLDLSLPDSNGIATVAKLRAALPFVPIVVLTGHDDNALAVAALQAGAQDYLVKGQFTHDALGRAVRYALVREKLERTLARSRQLYAALSQCNQAIVRCGDEAELFPTICRVAVEFGGMKMAWIGYPDPVTRKVRPVASYGDGAEYLQDIEISFDADSPFGHGPTGSATREARPHWCEDFQNDPATAPWHDRGRRFGWGASAALPLYRNGSVAGTFTLYAGETNVFDEAARRLLLEMSTDIGFALTNFSREAERKLNSEMLAQFKHTLDQTLDSVFMLREDDFRLTYANEGARKQLGYSGDELLAMTPLDFDPELTPGRLAELVQPLRDGTQRQITYQTVHRRKDRQDLAVEVSLQLVREEKQASRFIAIVRDITERLKAEAHIQWLSHFDTLTGLANHAVLNDRFNRAVPMAQRNRKPMALMSLDLDHFKNINDALGRHVGDALLFEIAGRIQSAVRDEDTVSRQGGDEFILLLPTSDPSGAAHVAEKLLQVIARSYRIEAHELVITPSIGIAIYPDDGEDFESLAKNADVAMYRAKQDGRNGYRFFAAEMQTRLTRTLQLEGALRHALEHDQLSLHYQPQIAMHGGQVVGAEALLRWQHPEFGMVSPAEFIPIAETSGQILQIGEWVVQTAARQMKVWMKMQIAPAVVAVNLSAVQFRHPKLTERVMQILDEAALAPHHLELELTEGVAMDDPLAAIAVMDALHERGIRMSIDDFGTGYSSLSYLKRFKVCKLKIDQSFVRNLSEDAEDKAIVISIIGLARSLGLKTIAEGVETRGQLDFLRESGCEEIQGYYYSKPLPPDAFEQFLRQAPREARVP